MIKNCTLLSGMPGRQASAERMFTNVFAGSFAEEWIGSQIQSMSMAQMVDDYLRHIPVVWDEIKTVLDVLGVTLVDEATAVDLGNAFRTQEVVALLAHHVEPDTGRKQGIELCHGVVDLRSIAEIAPTRPIIVHLGVCRSATLVETLKSRCGQVRVISSQAQVEPEFFLRTFMRTVQLWRRDGGDYVEAHIKLRMAMLDALGVIE